MNGNTITRTGAAAGTSIATSMVALSNGANMYGIHDDNNGLCELKKNSITNVGSGFFVANNCNNSRFECNNVTTAHSGFYFANAMIGNQVLNGGNFHQGNCLTTINTNRLDGPLGGLVATTFWYFNASGPSCLIPTPTSSNLLMLHLSTLGSQNTNCPLYGITEFPDTTYSTQREELAGGTVRRTDSLPLDDTDQFRYYNCRMVNGLLLSDSVWLHVSDGNDSLYQRFIDSLNGTALGDFARLDSFFVSKNYLSADSVRLTISPASSMDENELLVDSIYLKMLQCDSLTADDESALLTVANEDLLLGGDAVNIARVILQYNPIPDTSSSPRLLRPTIDEDNRLLTVYPNPSNGSFTIQFPLLSGESAGIGLADISGREVCRQRMFGSETELNCNNLTSGVYFGTMQLSSGKIYHFKMVIVSD